MGRLLSAIVESSLAVQGFLGVRPRLRLVPAGRLARLSSVLTVLSRSDEASETRLAEKFQALQFRGDLSVYESQALDRLRGLMELRLLAFGRIGTGSLRLRQGLVSRPTGVLGQTEADLGIIRTQEIMDHAQHVGNLYWSLFDACQGEFAELIPFAQQLFFQLFGQAFQIDTARARIARQVDALERDGGISFLVVNLLRQGAVAEARRVGQALQHEEIELKDAERATALYWLAEITWFANAWDTEHLTHEQALKHLYHLCFTAPDRAGFLEIDGAFADEVGIASELALEAFLYKETLVQSFLELWAEFEGEAEPLVRRALTCLLQTSETMSDRFAWERHWARVHAVYGKDYVYLSQGNLAYDAGDYAEAADCYETALALTPDLRPALLNLLLAYARLGRAEEHRHLVSRLERDVRFLPGVLLAAANSFLLLGDNASSRYYFDQLAEVPGWAAKRDYYHSTFCRQNGLHEVALFHAEVAHARNPESASLVHHLSLCYAQLGRKEEALQLLGALPRGLDWIDFFRFTLERDLGREAEAAQTLLGIPSDYFEDGEELDAALAFARSHADIAVLRHLRKKNPGRS